MKLTNFSAPELSSQDQRRRTIRRSVIDASLGLKKVVRLDCHSYNADLYESIHTSAGSITPVDCFGVDFEACAVEWSASMLVMNVGICSAGSTPPSFANRLSTCFMVQ